MLKIYGIPNCNSVKKAFDWLKNEGIAFEFHNYKKEGISIEKLAEWSSKISYEKLLNKAGTTFKTLTDEEKAKLNEQSAVLAYLAAATSAIKRPLIEKPNGEIVLGFDESTYKAEFL